MKFIALGVRCSGLLDLHKIKPNLMIKSSRYFPITNH